MMREFPIASIISVHDGDSFKASIDLGINVFATMDIRVMGVDTPEITGVTKPEGTIVRDAVKAWFAARSKMTLLSYEWDKYGGRLLADVRVGEDLLSKYLIDHKLAVIYNGEKKLAWTVAGLAVVRAFKA